MAEEEHSPSPRSRRDSVRNRDSDPEFNRAQPGRTDRKSLAGMSESVKAILAPLLGGKKSHSKVEVDMGRESGTVYETVDTGSTPMQRYNTVEAEASVASSPGATASSITQEGTGTDTITTPRSNNFSTSDALGPQEIKGKYEEKVDTPARTRSPIDPASARVDNFLSATKPKMKEYDEYITETAPKLRARMDSILGDKSHEAGFERKLPGGEMKLPELKPEEPPSLLDRVKDTVTGQVPGHGIYSGKATIDEPDQVGTSLQSWTVGRFDKDTARAPGTEGSGVPGPNPNENHLHENMDAVDQLKDIVAAAKEKSSLEGDKAPSPPIVTEPEGGLPLHPTSSANNPQVAPIRRRTMPAGTQKRNWI